MKGKILKKDFFNRKTLMVARELLGKYIVRKIGDKERAYKIVETEAYIGPHDLASHSSKGKTPRTAPMFGSGGTLYIYLVYGMHWMLNVVTETEDYPAAVLIRGIEEAIGPGRVTTALGIDKRFNNKIANKETGVWFEDRGEKPRPKDILRTARIGVDYAGPIWAVKKYRFTIPAQAERPLRAM
jgi:DNA-3-methyladenine glycosylase